MPARILIVDDDPATRTGMKALLERSGYEIRVAATFEDARRELHDYKPDLLISDIRLGEYNGLQLLVATPDPVPTIIVTAYQDPVLEAEARANGALFLLKPIIPEMLYDTVRRVLSGEARVPKRRWSRKRLTRAVSAEVNGSAAWVVDVSYGGLRVEFERRPELPSSFVVEFPGLQIPVDLVWQQDTSGEGLACGLAIMSASEQESGGWQGLVDSIH